MLLKIHEKGNANLKTVTNAFQKSKGIQYQPQGFYITSKN